MKEKKVRHIGTSQFIIIGFLSVILIGTMILMMPISSKENQITSFVDALFTATSATCVTGLIVQDTATYWSTFGQMVILFLHSGRRNGSDYYSYFVNGDVRKKD